MDDETEIEYGDVSLEVFAVQVDPERKLTLHNGGTAGDQFWTVITGERLKKLVRESEDGKR